MYEHHKKIVFQFFNYLLCILQTRYCADILEGKNLFPNYVMLYTVEKEILRWSNFNKRPISGYKRPISGDKRPISGYKRPISGYKRPISGYKRPISGYKRPIPGYKRPISGYKRPISGKENFQSYKPKYSMQSNAKIFYNTFDYVSVLY